MGIAALPGLLKLLATGASIGGTALSIAGQIQQTRQRSAILERNAAIDRQEAQIRERKGQDTQQAIRARGRRLLASQRVGFAHGGVTGIGSPLEIALETRTLTDLEAIEEEFNTVTEAARLRDSARFRDRQARSVRRAGKIGIGASLFTGARDLALTSLRFR